MIEKQLEDRMRAAVAGEPPLGFDPDEVVDRAIRRTRQRRTTAAAVVATGLVLAAVVTTMVTTTADHETATDPPTAGRTCGDVSPDGAPTQGFPAAGANLDRLNAAVPRLLAEHVPLARFERADMLAYGCWPVLSGSYAAAGANWHLTIWLGHRRNTLDLTGDRYWRDESERVSDTTAPDGARIRVYRQEFYGGVTSDAVVRLGTDGMITEVAVTETTASVRVDDLRVLATDPALRFDPPR